MSAQLEPLIEKLQLVPARPEYARQWYSWRNESSSKRFNPLQTRTQEELAVRLDQCGSDLSDEQYTEYRWFIVFEDAIVGSVALTNMNWVHRHASLGYQVGETHQGKGFATEGVRQLMEMAWSRSTLHRVEALIHTGNVPSRRLVERLGFVHEGTLRDYFQIEGRYVDEELYAMIRPH